jgi:hypothetical protein
VTGVRGQGANGSLTGRQSGGRSIAVALGTMVRAVRRLFSVAKPPDPAEVLVRVTALASAGDLAGMSWPGLSRVKAPL